MTGDEHADTPDGNYSLPFWEALADDRFLVHRCRSCASNFFPPAPVCPHCGDQSVEWHEASGRGRLYSFTRQHTAPPGFEAPLVVGAVDLEAGPRLLAPVDAEYETLRIGIPVEIAPTEYAPEYDRGALSEYPFFEAVPIANADLEAESDGVAE